MKPWLSRRLDYGHYDHLMRELEAEDVVSFRNFVWMDPDMVQEVYQPWTQTCNRTSLLGHWREIQESDVCLQSSTQHHLSHSKTDL